MWTAANFSSLTLGKAGKEISKDRVAIVGVGNVGATTAYALLLSGLAPDIVLINRDRNKAEGEAEDIRHAEPWSHTTLLRAGGFEDCATAKVIVVTVGTGLKQTKTPCSPWAVKCLKLWASAT